jgi:hypothetical protein
MAARVALLALLPFSSVFAFSNTVPFVAWSSQRYPITLCSHTKPKLFPALRSDVLSNLAPGTRPSHGTLLEDIISNGDICSYDAIVVVDHPGVGRLPEHPLCHSE